MFVRIKITFCIYVNANVMKKLVHKGKKLWHLFIGGSTVSMLHSLYEEAVYYLPFSSDLPLGFEISGL